MIKKCILLHYKTFVFFSFMSCVALPEQQGQQSYFKQATSKLNPKRWFKRNVSQTANPYGLETTLKNQHSPHLSSKPPSYKRNSFRDNVNPSTSQPQDEKNQPKKIESDSEAENILNDNDDPDSDYSDDDITDTDSTIPPLKKKQQ